MPARSHSIFFLLLTSCVVYTPDDVDPVSLAAELDARPGGHFSLDGAITLALRQNPELAAGAARLRAATARRVVPLPVLGEFRGRSRAWGLMVDPVALLGLGPRGAEIDAATAEAQAAAAELAVTRWETIAALTEAFFVEEGLAALQLDDLELDAAAFERAGLASAADASLLRAAQAKARRERADLTRARRDNLARVRRLLGLPRTAPVALLPVEEGWFEPPAGTSNDLFRRPDLRLAAARFAVADAAFRQAVAEQYPSIQLGPNFSFAGDPLRAMAMLRIPLGAHGIATAARERREAARHELLGKCLSAEEEMTGADHRRTVARIAAESTAAMLRASQIRFQASRTGIQVDPDAFAPYAMSAGAMLEAFHAHRQAIIERARAEIAWARAYGWPRQAEPEAGS